MAEIEVVTYQVSVTQAMAAKLEMILERMAIEGTAQHADVPAWIREWLRQQAASWQDRIDDEEALVAREAFRRASPEDRAAARAVLKLAPRSE